MPGRSRRMQIEEMLGAHGERGNMKVMTIVTHATNGRITMVWGTEVDRKSVDYCSLRSLKHEDEPLQHGRVLCRSPPEERGG